jgi:hypothetical protein
MSIMTTSIVRELGIMHLVSSHETYKATSRTITTALGRLDDILAHVGNVVFLVVDTDTYDLLLGLNFLMKIGAMVDVKKTPYKLGMDLGLMWKCYL